MKQSLKFVLVGLGILTLGAILWLMKPMDGAWDSSLFSPQSPEQDPATSASLAPLADPGTTSNTTADSDEGAEEVSPLAAELNSSRFPPQHDVDTLHALLRQHLRRLGRREGLPIGNDSDLAAVLKGQNPMKYAALPKNHPVFGSNGRLLDRWGTPYFVHPVAEADFEIRSAGPDRKMFTPDDLIADPAGESLR